MRYCSKCGFPLGTRPGLIEVDGVCGACINAETKKTIDFKARQEWLTKYIAENKTHPKYDCLVAVSGGKDSHAIVRRLYEKHGVKNALLFTVTDEFTHTLAGRRNIDNLVRRYNCDHILFRCEPGTFAEESLKDFENELHPLKWIEEKIYSKPIEFAKALGIKLVFFGENSAFEYGTSTDLDIFHPASYVDKFRLDETVKPFGAVFIDKNLRSDVQVIFMGAIWPYSIGDSLQQAMDIGFVDLDDTHEWTREGSIDQYTQIDSVGYMVQLWTKYVKFGFQRVADIASRFVRETNMPLELARRLIDKYDYILDRRAKADFCRVVGITEGHFDSIVEKHANLELVERRDDGWHVKG